MVGTVGMKARQLTKGIWQNFMSFYENYHVEGWKHLEIMYMILWSYLEVTIVSNGSTNSHSMIFYLDIYSYITPSFLL